jgi:DNA-binding transcriptional ArsR family regulator
MQESNNISEYIKELNSEFIEVIGGSFCKVDTGEIFTKAELTKYMKLKIEEYSVVNMASIKYEANKVGVEIDQSLYNSRSKKKTSNKVKQRYDGGEFNMIYRERIGDIMSLKLNATEKGVWYSLGELSTYPTNTVMMNSNIPSFEELSKYVGMSDRNLRRYLKVLEDKNLIKFVQCGFKKAIVVNPEYYATGKDLDLETLKLFGLIECDDEKIESYL